MITRRKHTFYDENLPYWERVRDAYSGGSEYIPKALIKHASESEVDYNERVSRAYYLNYPRRIANLITQYCLASSPVRENAPQEIKDDFTLEKINVDELMRQVSTSLNLYGMVWFLVSMPFFEGELTLEEKQKKHIRPYAAAIKPYDVTDWSYDASGELNWVIIRTFKRYDDDPFSSAIIAERFCLYTKDFVRIYEKGGDVPIMEYPNTLGIVPVFRIQEIDGYAMDSRHYFEEIVRISDAILNNESEAQMNLVKQMFGMLVCSESYARNAGKSPDKTSNIISRSTAIIESAEEKGITRYISPAGVETAAIREENKALKQEMYDIIGMALNSISHAQQTAESKSWDFHSVSRFLANRADLLEQAENKIWQLMRLYDPSIPEVSAAYSRKFEVEDLTSQVKALLDIDNLSTAPLSLKKQVCKSALKIIDRIAPMGDEQMQEIIEDIEDMEPAPAPNLNF